MSRTEVLNQQMAEQSTYFARPTLQAPRAIWERIRRNHEKKGIPLTNPFYKGEIKGFAEMAIEAIDKGIGSPPPSKSKAV